MNIFTNILFFFLRSVLIIGYRIFVLFVGLVVIWLSLITPLGLFVAAIIIWKFLKKLDFV